MEEGKGQSVQRIKMKEKRILDKKEVTEELKKILEHRISPGTLFRDVVIKEIISDFNAGFVIIDNRS